MFGEEDLDEDGLIPKERCEGVWRSVVSIDPISFYSSVDDM